MAKSKESYIRVHYSDKTSKVVPTKQYKYDNRIVALSYASMDDYDLFKK